MSIIKQMAPMVGPLVSTRNQIEGFISQLQ